MKKVLLCFLVVTLIFSLFAFNASAATVTGTVAISSGSLNVRASASTTSSIIGKLSNGAQVTIYGMTNGFYQIPYGGKTAYVSAAYVINNQRTTIVNVARSAIGVKYVFLGATMNGFDCSGLTLYCYAKAGITLPHQSAQQSTKGTFVSKANLKPGDLVFFDTNGGRDGINHVGIYTGNNMFISALSGSGKVIEQNMTYSYWANAYMTARRLILQ